MDMNGGETFQIGTVLNQKWVILEFIGKGGMGEVYRAHQLNLKRDVAIKVISKEWVRSLEGDTREATACLERFRREMEVMAQIRHPNVIQIFDYGSVEVKQGEEVSSVEYMVMEYIPGSTLRSTMSEEGFHPEEDRVIEWLTTYFLPVLDGVHALHEAGIVHRDLKPENILLDRNTPKIADFGLARSCQVKSMTQSFDVKGTPPYMSPEHFLDLKRADERADIYGLGKILYEAVAGKMGPDTIPFKRVRLPEADSPFFQELDRIIQKATAEEKDLRYASATDFKEAIEALCKETKAQPAVDRKSFVPEGRRWKVALAVVSIALIIGAVTFFLHEKPHFQSTPEISAPAAPQEGERAAGENVPAPPPASTPPEKLHGSDYDIMRLVPGGTITLPETFGPEGGKTVTVKPFYMNEIPVTNQQYVDFLNDVLPRIRVEGGLVRGDGRIWLMLGEIIKGYEPIVFRNGRFRVKNAAHSACPVLRVTAYGASAYVKFYGLRLPTEREWILAVTQGKTTTKESAPDRSGTSWGMGMMGDMHSWKEMPQSSPQDREAELPPQTPVTIFKPNAYGIRQLNRNIGEWGVRITQDPGGKNEPQTIYVVMGGPAGQRGQDSAAPPTVQRNPWESFEEVGFRCVRDAPAGKDDLQAER